MADELASDDGRGVCSNKIEKADIWGIQGRDRTPGSPSFLYTWLGRVAQHRMAASTGDLSVIRNHHMKKEGFELGVTMIAKPVQPTQEKEVLHQHLSSPLPPYAEWTKGTL